MLHSESTLHGELAKPDRASKSSRAQAAGEYCGLKVPTNPTWCEPSQIL